MNMTLPFGTLFDHERAVILRCTDFTLSFLTRLKDIQRTGAFGLDAMLEWKIRAYFALLSGVLSRLFATCDRERGLGSDSPSKSSTDL